MGQKHTNGQCITRKPKAPGSSTLVQCPNERVPPTWYCQPCTDEYHGFQTRNRDRSTGDGRSTSRSTTSVIMSGSGTANTSPRVGKFTKGDLDRMAGQQQAGDPTMPRQTQTGDGKSWTEHYEHLITPTSPSGIRLANRPLCERGGLQGQGHDGQTPVWTFADGRVLYGAQGSKLNTPGALDHVDLVLDCAGMVKDPFVDYATVKYRGKLGPDLIRLRWPDMTAPVHVGIRFWQRLYAALPGQTVVCCVGSHGRTGTALACLLVASGMDPELAIKTIRDKHCPRAIETAEQEKYVRQLAADRDSQAPAQGTPVPIQDGGTK